MPQPPFMWEPTCRNRGTPDRRPTGPAAPSRERPQRAEILVGPGAARVARHQAKLAALDAVVQRRARRPLAGHDVEEVAHQLEVAAVVAGTGRLEAVALDAAGGVVVDRQLVAVPVELDGALVADEGRAA